jgi:protein ImuA
MLQTRDAPRADTVALAPGLELARARAHEAIGPSRQVFALLLAAAMSGPVLWLQPSWNRERLMGDGIRAFLDPGRLVFGDARTAPELLWAAEEALRSGAVPLAVVDLPSPPALTPVRRLHLAAEAGAGRGAAPVALLLTPGAGGAPGIETRWHLAPRPGWAADGTARWLLTRSRARMAPEQSHEIRIVAGRLRLVPS